MRKVTATDKINLKDIVIYLERTVKEKSELLQEQKSHVNNPSIRDMYFKAEGARDLAEWILMSIKTNSKHYLK